jgi:hypothetical protein
MMLTNTITKKALEKILSESFSKFGDIASSSLLDSLKLLGFSYATFAGISINIEDLKTPKEKKELLNKTNEEIDQVSIEWSQGNLSDAERFQTIIDSWNLATESLKNRIIEYYQNFDPLNNLYIMAFSGARGNMSQVRQLVGMRGLMSDQDGKIIDLPIQSNFREGLSSIDYIISSYGARKGIVDTALKTADSGYLTRRLIYLAQDLVIRQQNCFTKKGILFFLEKKTNITNLLGRSLIFFQTQTEKKNEEKNIFLTSEILESLKVQAPLTLKLRSPLSCDAMHSICQTCYGWDLSQKSPISLGEAVGIVAAQSIGEPGTQLTMRTFHTGGIFTGELVNQVVAPFSGKLFFPESLKLIPYRTSHGILVSKLQQEVKISLMDWLGNTKEIFLEIGSFLYAHEFHFLKKGDLIAEFFNQAVLPGKRNLKPIFSKFSGEIRFDNLNIRKIIRDAGSIKVNQEEGILWLSSGKLYLFPKEIYFCPKKAFQQQKPFAWLTLVTPQEGILKIFSKKIFLKTKKNKYFLNLENIEFSIKNTISKLSIVGKNYQKLDNYSLFGYFYFFPKEEGKIYLIRKKDSIYQTIFFVVTEKEIWKIFSDNQNEFSFLQLQKPMLKKGNELNPTLRSTNAGFFLKKDGFTFIFQKAYPIFLSQGSLLNYNHGDFILEKKVLGHLVNFTQQTEDIVQGLPKIEELIEARKPKTKAYLANRPGIFLNSLFIDKKRFHLINRIYENQVIKCISFKPGIEEEDSKKKPIKQSIFFLHSLFLKEDFILIRKKIYKQSLIPSIFQPFEIIDEEKPKKTKKTKKKKIKIFQFFYKNHLLRCPGRLSFSTWFKKNQSFQDFSSKNEESKFLDISSFNEIFENNGSDFIVCTKKKASFFFEYLNPINMYKIPLSSKQLFSPGNFVDLGEPFTEGMIDVHELLNIFLKYHTLFDGTFQGSFKGLHKFQLILVNSIQAIYHSQGVNISSKHLEIIVRQMTGKAVIKESGDSPLLAGEFIRLSLISQIYQSFAVANTKFPLNLPIFEPLIFSSTNSSLTKEGFLSSAGFQETKRILSKAAIEGSTDWLRGLKECIIIGRLIPAGSTFFNYKNYLDNVYLFKKN